MLHFMTATYAHAHIYREAFRIAFHRRRSQTFAREIPQFKARRTQTGYGLKDKGLEDALRLSQARSLDLASLLSLVHLSFFRRPLSQSQAGFLGDLGQNCYSKQSYLRNNRVSFGENNFPFRRMLAKSKNPFLQRTGTHTHTLPRERDDGWPATCQVGSPTHSQTR